MKIFTDSTNSWFYLVPDSAELPAGGFRIVSLLREEVFVERSSLIRYVVPREIAEAYLSGQLRQGLEHVSESVLGFLRTAYTQPAKRSNGSRWNVDFLAELFDQPAEAVRHDPEATKQGLLGLFAEAAYFFDSVKSGDEERLQIARQQVAGFTDILRRHGVQVDDAIHNLPDYLAEVYQQANDE